MSLSPLNESGMPVDWWFMYKVPKLKASSGVQASTGFEYAYFDSDADAIAMRSPFTLDSDNGAFFHTLDALFSNPSASTGWILYNDETPDGQVSLTLGHSKGAIGFDVATNTAFWLLHSWPKFPTPDDTAQPSPMFGQTFLCIALDLDAARELAKQMHGFQEPQLYSPRIPTSLAVDDPLRLLTTGIRDNDPAGTNVLDLNARRDGIQGNRQEPQLERRFLERLGRRRDRGEHRRRYLDSRRTEGHPRGSRPRAGSSRSRTSNSSRWRQSGCLGPGRKQRTTPNGRLPSRVKETGSAWVTSTA